MRLFEKGGKEPHNPPPPPRSQAQQPQVVPTVATYGPDDRLIFVLPAGLTVEQLDRFREALDDEFEGRHLVVAGCQVIVERSA
jgi:hypothetical protein